MSGDLRYHKHGDCVRCGTDRVGLWRRRVDVGFQALEEPMCMACQERRIPLPTHDAGGPCPVVLDEDPHAAEDWRRYHERRRRESPR